MLTVKNKTTRHTWSEENMREALEKIQQKKMGWKLASKTYNVPATPLISLQTPENTSAARSQAFNRANIAAYFKSLEEVLTLYNFAVENIYNMDETGFRTTGIVPYNPDIFEDWMFAPAETTHRPLAEENLTIAETEEHPSSSTGTVTAVNRPNQFPKTYPHKNSVLGTPTAGTSKLSVSIDQVLPKVSELPNKTAKTKKERKNGHYQFNTRH